MIPLLASAAMIGLLSQTPTKPPPPPPASPVVTPNPFRHLFPNLGHDLKALGEKDTLWIAGAAAAATLVAHNNDGRMKRWVLAQGSVPPTSAVGNFIGDGFVQAGAATAVWLGGRWSHHAKVEATGADLVRAQAVNGVLTQGLKRTIRRTRPNGGHHSFPSGHTSATFASAAVIQHHFGAAASFPIYALGSFVGWSRIRSNHHWLSDAVAGAAIGIISGRAATRHHSQKWTVTPVKTPGGVALFVTRKN